jgi:hypothetical protein
LGGQDGQAQDGAAFADEFAGEGDALAGEAFEGAVAFVLGEVEVGLAFVDDGDQERQVVGGAAGVPGVPLPSDRHDVAEAAAHFGVLVFEDLEGVGELVAAVPPGAVVPGFLVAAVLAVQEGELGGGGRGELAEPGGDEAGLPIAGQAGDADAGEPAQRQVPVAAEVVAADIQHIGDVRCVGAGRAALGAEWFGEGVGAQGADDKPAGCGLGDADAD